MSEERQQEFRPVNQILGSQPSLGPIPADFSHCWLGNGHLVDIIGW